MTTPERHALTALCRDCLELCLPGQRRCPSCGSPRILDHPEMHALQIAHIDCDAFYASIEKRDDPRLRDRPVIVGGGKRGVVSTCCYIARISGVRSAMPMFKALALCPEAVVVRPDMAKYAAVGRQVRDMMLALTPLVEPLSIDEAFLDLTGTERLHGASAAVTLARLARRIESDIGITVSVGLSYCKFLAKMASDFDKPRGFSIVGQAEAMTLLADKPVGTIWGVGRVAEERLRQDGFAICFASMDPKAVVSGAWRAASTTARSNPTAKPRASPPKPPSKAMWRMPKRFPAACSCSAKRSRPG